MQNPSRYDAGLPKMFGSMRRQKDCREILQKADEGVGETRRQATKKARLVRAGVRVQDEENLNFLCDHLQFVITRGPDPRAGHSIHDDATLGGLAGVDD